MKLNLFITTFLILFQIGYVFGQDFAPLGATWYYSQHYAFSGNIDYFKIESTKDTVINEKNCKKLVMNYAPGCTGRGSREFVYQEDSVIYFYDTNFSEFQTLFNLKANKDNTWYIKIMDYDQEVDTLFVNVDSTDIIEINSKNLKKLYVKYSGTYNGDTLIQYNSQILEIIGDINYLFNLYPIWSGACDMDYSGGLRCYSDEFISNYETGIAESCTYRYVWTGINEMQRNHEIQIFPNPTTGVISIISDSNKLLKITVLDLSGKVLLSQDLISNNQINISNFQAGFYILKVETDNAKIIVESIVKY